MSDALLLSFYALMAVQLVAAIIYDARAYRIPNYLAAALAISGVIAIAIIDFNALGAHLLCGLVALAIGFLLFQFTGMGAGDGKLVGAIFIWIGPGGVIPFLFWFGAACTVIVVVLIPTRWLIKDTDKGLGRWRPFQKDAPVPLALAIAPAGIIAGAPIYGLV